MTIRRLTEEDAEMVRTTMTHPRVFPWIGDDESPVAAEFHPVFDEQSIIYLGAWSEHYLGLWMFVRQNAITYAVHTCLLPQGWGTVGRVAADAAQDWIWENTKAQRIITSVPADNTLALRFARNAGMVEFGRNPRSFLRNGLVLDEIWLGLSRPESEVIQCQH